MRMNGVRIELLAVAGLLACPGGGPDLGVAIAEPIEVRQLTDTGTHQHPSLNRGWVTWVGWDGDSYEIMIANLDAAVVAITTLTDDGGEKAHPSSSGSERIVWQGRGLHGSDWEIYVYDKYATPRWAPLTDNAEPDTRPSLGAAGNIAWLSGAPLFEAVHYWTESLHSWSVISDACCPTSAFSNEPPSAHGYEVAWRTYERGVDHRFIYWDGAASELALPAGTDLSLYDGTLAYVGGAGGSSQILYWDGMDVTPIGDGSGTALAPSLYDGRIAFEQYDGQDWEIHYWDGSRTIQITDNEIDDTQPSLYGDKVAWVGRPPAGFGQIYYATGLPEPGGAASGLASLAVLALLARRRGAGRCRSRRYALGHVR